MNAPHVKSAMLAGAISTLLNLPQIEGAVAAVTANFTTDGSVRIIINGAMVAVLFYIIDTHVTGTTKQAAQVIANQALAKKNKRVRFASKPQVRRY
jgi:hypothetical protein